MEEYTSSIVQEEITEDKAYNELVQEYAQKKKKLFSNIVELAVWGALLAISINYLWSHPAEKTSIFSWLEVIMQRVEIIMSNIFHSQWEELREKYDLEKSYVELVALIEEWRCWSLEDVKMVNEKLTFMRSLSLDQFIQQKSALIGFARIMYTKIKENCEDKTYGSWTGGWEWTGTQ